MTIYEDSELIEHLEPPSIRSRTSEKAELSETNQMSKTTDRYKSKLT